MRCVLLQCEPAWQDLDSSRTQLAKMLEAEGDVCGALVVTPEMAESGFTMHPQHACDDRGAHFAATLARTHGCFLQHGFIERSATGFRNVVGLFAPDGACLLRYAKHQLFSPAGEMRAFEAGTSIATARVADLLATPMICYDLRFPELWRHAALAGTEVYTLSACWPQVRQAHWRALAIARAIENQAFVIACNRVGNEPNARYIGGSMVIAPDGEVLAEAGSERTALHATLDISRLREWRAKFPALRDIDRSLLGDIPARSGADSARID